MDLVLQPLKIEFRVKLLLEFKLFRRSFRKVLLNFLLWDYQCRLIEANMFNYNDAEPDNTGPDFSMYAKSVRTVLHIISNYNFGNSYIRTQSHYDKC